MVTRSSTSRSRSQSFGKLERDGSESNVAWLERAIAETSQIKTLTKRKEPPPSECTYVLLLGAKDPYSFRLRHAQAVLRYDLTPSAWSHTAMLVDQKSPLAESVLVEISLRPPRGFWLPTTSNGLQVNTLDYYDDSQLYPNIALLRIPVDRSLWLAESEREHRSVIETFVKQRVVLDVAPLIHRWLAHVWSIDHGENPLAVGIGMPGASALEALLQSAGYDISPGLESKQSSPEAFWQSARWWHPFFEAMDRSEIAGRWAIGHYLDRGRFPNPDEDRRRYLGDPDGPRGATSDGGSL